MTDLARCVVIAALCLMVTVRSVAPEDACTIIRTEDPSPYRLRAADPGGNFTCHIQRVVKCDPKANARPGRALVIYSHAFHNNDPFNFIVEDANFAFFLRHGIIHPSVSLKQYSGVDYILLRPNPDVKTVTSIRKVENVELVHVPMGPCDLCSVSRIVDYIGLARTKVNYRTVFLANSGVRGPFVANGSSPWIDLVSVIGREVVGRGDPDPITATSVSFEIVFHPQSYFLAIPIDALIDVLLPKYENSCSHSKNDCIIDAEIASGDALLKHKFVIHSMAQNVTITSREQAPSTRPKVGESNPTFRWIDPCSSLFLKFGGEAMRVELVPRSLMRTIQRLTVQQDEMLLQDTTTPRLNIFENCNAVDCDW